MTYHGQLASGFWSYRTLVDDKDIAWNFTNIYHTYISQKEEIQELLQTQHRDRETCEQLRQAIERDRTTIEQLQRVIESDRKTIEQLQQANESLRNDLRSAQNARLGIHEVESSKRSWRVQAVWSRFMLKMIVFRTVKLSGITIPQYDQPVGSDAEDTRPPPPVGRHWQ